MEILESIPENPEVEDLKYQSITYRVPAWSWRLKYQKLFYISVLRAKPPWKGYNYREEKKSNKLVLIHRQESKFFFSYITMAVYKCRSGSEIWAYHLEQKEEKITWRIELVNDTQGNQKTKTCTKDKQKKKEKREGGGGGGLRQSYCFPFWVRYALSALVRRDWNSAHSFLHLALTCNRKQPGRNN